MYLVWTSTELTNQSNKTFSKVYSENKISNLNNNVQEISNLNLTTQQVKNIVQLNKISQYNKTQNLNQINENIFKVLNVSNNKTIKAERCHIIFSKIHDWIPCYKIARPKGSKIDPQ